MFMAMDGMALLDAEGETQAASFTTFERIKLDELGTFRLRQAAACHTDAEVSTATGCKIHLARLERIKKTFMEATL